MKKITLSLIIIVSICFAIDTTQPGGNQIAQFAGGLALFGLTIIILFGLLYVSVTHFDEAKINAEYHDAPEPAPMNSKTTIRPREGGPVPDYIPKWQRPGYDPYED